MVSVCLNMIVKDEVAVIQRCLDSVRSLIDRWVICDTGSTDGTQEFVQSYFRRFGLPGALHQHEWRDFGHNRTRALDVARGQGDYVLVMDADDILVAQDGFRFDGLDADAYRLRHKQGAIDHYKERLVRADQDWRWEGVLHEFLTRDGAPQVENLADGPWISARTEGNRSQDPERFARDAALLQAALEREPENTRYLFYLAQSLRDAGQLEAALAHYRRRAIAGGWVEEAFYSRYQAAHLLEALSRPWSECLDAHLEAWRARPERLEPLYHAMRICRGQGLWSMGYQLAQLARSAPRTRDILFLEVDVYRWRVLDEWAVAATWIGRWQEALMLNRRILRDATLPAEERTRIHANLDLRLEHVPANG